MLSSRNESFVAGHLETGTDSPFDCQHRYCPHSTHRSDLPVSILSLTMQSPVNRRLSHGNCVIEGSDTSYTSPGTSSPLSTCRPG